MHSYFKDFPCGIISNAEMNIRRRAKQHIDPVINLGKFSFIFYIVLSREEPRIRRTYIQIFVEKTELLLLFLFFSPLNECSA